MVFFTIFTELCGHHHYLINIFNIPQRNPISMSSHFPFSPFPRPWQPLIYFLFRTFHINEIIQYMTFCIWLSLSIMFSRFFHVVAYISTSFWWLNNIPLYGYITFCLSIHQLMNIWITSTFWLLWIMMLWTFMYRFLCGHMLSIFLGIYLGVKLLAHMVTLCLKFWGTAKLSSQVAPLFYKLPSNIWLVISPHPHHLLLPILL